MACFKSIISGDSMRTFPMWSLKSFKTNFSFPYKFLIQFEKGSKNLAIKSRKLFICLVFISLPM